MPGPRPIVVLLVALVVPAAACAAIQLGRPVPAVTSHIHLADSYSVPGGSASLPWPVQGQAALYLSGFGWIGSTGAESSVPIASVTKVMTALVILRAHPLALGQPGPGIAVSTADLSVYQSEMAAGDSVVRVQAGEVLTELQLLEGLLLPSGDNLAVILADWDAGSEPTFVTAMNQLAASLHLDHTRFADSSGLSAGSVSTAQDLVTLAAVAMKNPVFASVVAMKTANLPVAGLVRNLNPILDTNGVIGIKTGWTAASLGCLVFAVESTVDRQPVQLIGSVLGQPGGPESSLLSAGKAALALISAGEAELRPVRVPAVGEVVGRVASAWGGRSDVSLSRPLKLVGLAGSAFRLRSRLLHLGASVRRGASVGSITLTTPGGIGYQARLVCERRLSPPTIWWRLTQSP